MAVLLVLAIAAAAAFCLSVLTLPETTTLLGDSSASEVIVARRRLSSSSTTTKTKKKTSKTVKKKAYDFQPLKNSRLAIFYNIFIPPDDEPGAARAKNIIEEQIDQLGCSYATLNKVSLYYITVGAPLSLEWMDQVCTRNQLQCRHIAHHSTGYEDLTLQQVYDFCQEEEHTDFRVLYMHSKGSYHDVETIEWSQSSWRWHMTAAIASRMCVEPPDESCDICGLQALAFPHLHFSGNFFSAKCSYIQKLIAPKQFEQKSNSVASKIMLMKLHGQILANLLPDRPHHFGIGRFANEHWLASHPDVKACDVSEFSNIDACKRPGPMPAAQFKFAMYPRHNVWEKWSYVVDSPEYLGMINNLSRRIREYYFLMGNLFRWYELYNKVPDKESWVWTWFPDGEYWLRMVQQYGREAISKAAEEYKDEDEIQQQIEAAAQAVAAAAPEGPAA